MCYGKSGSGKSFATKSILANFAAENSKIFILDPENEYQELAHNLGGKLIDVGTAKEGRLNPFHVITTLEADETEQQDIVNNNRGSAFMITGPLSRVNASVVASDYIRTLFGEGQIN